MEGRPEQNIAEHLEMGNEIIPGDPARAQQLVKDQPGVERHGFVFGCLDTAPCRPRRSAPLSASPTPKPPHP